MYVVVAFVWNRFFVTQSVLSSKKYHKHVVLDFRILVKYKCTLYMYMYSLCSSETWVRELGEKPCCIIGTMKNTLKPILFTEN